MEQATFSIARPLLEWYQNNARVLPWRENPEPYRVWISEIMLQQTRVEAVKPYFARFLAALPDPAALAAVSEEQLMKLWEGLGYYSRARNLQKAAVILQEQYGGRLPGSYEELLRLPGIGEYTAGAIASIAFGQPVAAVDGNVIRVCARLTASAADYSKPAEKARLREWVMAQIPEGKAGDFNQALMELGATVCLPNAQPKCGECPLRAACKGLAQGDPESYPFKPVKRGRRIEEKTVFVVLYRDQVALRKRPGKGLLAGLWEFPNSPGTLGLEEAALEARKQGFSAIRLRPAAEARHIFTHVEWHMQGFFVFVGEEGGEDCVFVTRSALERDYALPSAFRAFLQALQSLPPMPGP